MGEAGDDSRRKGEVRVVGIESGGRGKGQMVVEVRGGGIEKGEVGDDGGSSRRREVVVGGRGDMMVLVGGKWWLGEGGIWWLWEGGNKR